MPARRLFLTTLIVLEGCASGHAIRSPQVSGGNSSDGISYEEVVALSNLVFDCNGNGIGDGTEIDTGVLIDVNDNGIPDDCENGVPKDPDRESRRSLLTITEAEGGKVAISYRLSRRTTLHVVRVLDTSGHLVTTLTEGPADVGNYSIPWNPSSLSDHETSQRYIVQLQVDGEKTAMVYDSLHDLKHE